MTVHDDILSELSKGPRTFTYLERKCSKPNLPPDHVLKTVSRMVSSKEIVVREWVVDRGRFVPVYERRRETI